MNSPLRRTLLTAPIPGGLAIAAILSCQLFAQEFRDQWFTNCLAAPGKHAFTWYMLHIGIVIACGIATRLSGNTTIGGLFSVEIVFVLLMLISSTLYAKRFRYGPLELLLRKVAR